MEKTYFGAKIAIEETEKYFIKQDESVGAFKSHQSKLLTSLSLIVSIAGLLIGSTDTKLEISPVILTIIAALFFVAVVINLVMIMPVELEAPLKPERENFDNLFIGKPDDVVLANKLKNYIIVIDNNRKIIGRLICLSWISTIDFLMIIGSLIYILLDIVW